MLTRPVPEFGEESRLHWGGGKKVALLHGEEEIDSISLDKPTFFNAAQAMEKLRRRLNQLCQG